VFKSSVKIEDFQEKCTRCPDILDETCPSCTHLVAGEGKSVDSWVDVIPTTVIVCTEEDRDMLVVLGAVVVIEDARVDGLRETVKIESVVEDLFVLLKEDICCVVTVVELLPVCDCDVCWSV